jgi:acetylornithine/N-succinyldiaminopimelate aminotransferase
VVQRLAEPAMLERLRANGEWLRRALGELAARTGRIRAVRGVGYMWGVDVMEPGGAVVTRALERGLLVCTAGDYTIRLLPPLIATREDLERGLLLLEGALR